MSVPQPLEAGVVSPDLIRNVLAQEVASLVDVPFDEIDVTKNLDEYGFDSIDAVITAGVLGQRLGLELPPELLIQYRTFEEIVGAVARLGWLGPVPQDVRSPVYMFPGGAGRDGRLARLAAQCESQVPSRIILIGSWIHWVQRRLRLPDLVSGVCDEIEASNRVGPLRLAGYSQGGALAFAVTLALQARGREVASLSIFDTRIEGGLPEGPVNAGGRRRMPASGFVRLVSHIIVHLWQRLASFRRPIQIGEGLRARVVAAMFRRLTPRPLKAVIWAAARTPALLWGRGGVQVDHIMQMQSFDLLWRDWLPHATALPDTPCRTFLFRSDDNKARGDLGWGRYCPGLIILPVSGGHHTMFDPENLEALVAHFVSALTQDERE